MKNFICKSLNYLFIGIIAIISTFVLFVVVEVPWKGGILDSAYIYFNFGIAAMIFSLLVIYLLKKSNFKLNDPLADKFALIIPFVVGTITMIIFKATPTSDAQTCFELADTIINEGIASALSNEYLKLYPFQLGYIYIVIIFKTLFNSYAVLAIQLFQIILYAIANLCLLNITRNMSQNLKINLSYITLSTIWIIPLMYSVYCYGFSLGLSLAIYSLYFIIKFNNTKSKKDLVLGLLFSVLATFAKPNYLLLNITYLLYFIFIYNASTKQKGVITALTIITLIFSSKSYQLVTKVVFNQDTPVGLPRTSWLVMGTVDSKQNNDLIYSAYEPGRWNGYNSLKYDMFGDDFEKYGEYDIQQLTKQFKFAITNPKSTLKFYFLKLANTYSVQDFMMTYTILPQFLPLDEEAEFFENGVGNLLFTTIMRSSLILIFIFSIIYVFKTKHFDDTFYIFIIYFMGGFFYHLLFETRSVYVYPYITLLLPIAAISLSTTLTSNSLNIKTLPIIAAITLFLGVSLNYLTNSYESIDGECYYNFNEQSVKLTNNTFISYDFDTYDINDKIIGFEIYTTGDIENTQVTAHIEGNHIDQYLNNEDVISNDYAHYRFMLNENLKPNSNYKITLFTESNNEAAVIHFGANEEARRNITVNGELFENSTLNFKLITIKHGNPLITDDCAKKAIPIIWQDECLRIANAENN